MSTQNFIFRAPDDLRRLADARAERDHCTPSDVGRSALRLYLTGDDGGEALQIAQARADLAEARVRRLEKALAAARAKNGTPTVEAARRARVNARREKDEAFAAALQAATEENPVTASVLAALTGFTRTWCHDLLSALGEAGYAEKIAGTGPRTGPGRPRFDWVPVPGKDISEGVRAVKSLVERGQARTGPRYREGGDLARPDTSVKFKPAEGS